MYEAPHCNMYDARALTFNTLDLSPSPRLQHIGQHSFAITITSSLANSLASSHVILISSMSLLMVSIHAVFFSAISFPFSIVEFQVRTCFDGRAYSTPTQSSFPRCVLQCIHSCPFPNFFISYFIFPRDAKNLSLPSRAAAFHDVSRL